MSWFNFNKRKEGTNNSRVSQKTGGTYLERADRAIKETNEMLARIEEDRQEERKDLEKILNNINKNLNRVEDGKPAPYRLEDIFGVYLLSGEREREISDDGVNGWPTVTKFNINPNETEFVKKQISILRKNVKENKKKEDYDIEISQIKKACGGGAAFSSFALKLLLWKLHEVGYKNS